VIALLDEWARTGLLFRDSVSFGIVTPFRLQVERIKESIRRRPWWEQVSSRLTAKDRLTVGTAHVFQGDERDVMIFSPVVADGMPEKLARWVAFTDQLLNVAITRARGALHVVGDRAACRKFEGSHLERFASAAFAVGATGGNGSASAAESPAETRMAEMLAETGLWYAPQHNVGRYRLDFLVVTPFGTRYDVEVDGRGHRTTEAVRNDEVRDAAVRASGLKVLRVDARRIFREETAIHELLRRLV
jgi:very-short-patch-repair endonuclease